MQEGKVKGLMRAMGIHAAPVENVKKIFVLLDDGSYLEFTDPKIMRMTLRKQISYQIRGEAMKVDMPSSFKLMFGEAV
jgi:NACalpha-BTF3-like transcription factor